SALKDIRGKNSVSYFKFTRDPTTEQLLASCTAIGRVDQVASDLADQVASDLADQQTKPQVSDYFKKSSWTDTAPVISLYTSLSDTAPYGHTDQQTKPQVSDYFKKV
ncbi:hypothetical protein MAR_012732, partial [Mya arenaria]